MNNKAAMIGLAVLLFLVAAVLVLLIVRMLFGGRLRMPGGRARQARLGIVDAFDLDRQRQLIIVRRDNTEHLIMIGGPNDVLIESEIVRVEARDLRDQRRDKPPEMAFPGVPGFGDARIPAPPPADRDVADREIAPPSVDEPLLPEIVAAPPPPASVPSAPPVAPAARAPTFPLPPRRPPPVAPERRPAPPLRLPDSVTRGDDIPMPPSAGPAPLPVPPTPAAAPVAPPVTADAPAVPPRPAPPPFLKPRPPIRPLQRTTPQAQPPAPPAAAPAAPPAAETPPPPPVEVKPAPPAAPAPPSPEPTPAAPPPPPAADSNDALESLEEEMAKLLGRGP